MRTVFVPFVLWVALGASAPLPAAEKSFDKVVSAEPKGVVDISNVAGSVQVSGWDRNEVSVHGDLDQDVERVDVTSQPGRTTIKVVLPNHARHAEAALRVQIPQGSELDVSAVSADVKVMKVQGVQRLQTVSGELGADLAQADTELKSVSGDITLHGHGQGANVHASTVSGDLRIEHAAGDLDLGTVSGEVKASVDGARGLRVRSTSGDVSFEGKLTRGASVDAESVSGTLTLRVSADGGFAYELSSFSGDIDNCFGQHAERTSQYSPGKVLRGTSGEGAGHVHLRSMSGGLEVCDK